MKRNIDNDHSIIQAWRVDLADKDRCEVLYEAARKQLNVIESYLTKRHRAGEEGAFLLGMTACHADFVLFGCYGFSRVNQETVQEVWQHSSLPKVGRWLDAMMASGLVNGKKLY